MTPDELAAIRARAAYSVPFDDDAQYRSGMRLASALLYGTTGTVMHMEPCGAMRDRRALLAEVDRLTDDMRTFHHFRDLNPNAPCPFCSVAAKYHDPVTAYNEVRSERARILAGVEGLPYGHSTDNCVDRAEVIAIVKGSMTPDDLASGHRPEVLVRSRPIASPPSERLRWKRTRARHGTGGRSGGRSSTLMTTDC